MPKFNVRRGRWVRQCEFAEFTVEAIDVEEATSKAEDICSDSLSFKVDGFTVENEWDEIRNGAFVSISKR
jgi:hypothetical protein